jgi:hypothetical protein
MPTIERITSTGDATKDAAAIMELHQESTGAQMTHEEAEEREQRAREFALEAPRNALVDTPYQEGETIEVIVHEGDEEDVTADTVNVETSDNSGDNEAAVDRKTAEGGITRQAISSPHPSLSE